MPVKTAPVSSRQTGILRPTGAILVDIPDVVLRWQRLKDGNGEGDSVSRLMHHLLRQQPGLRVVDVLVLGVLHPDVPPHAIAMCPVLPLESGLDAQLHPQHRPGAHHTSQQLANAKFGTYLNGTATKQQLCDSTSELSSTTGVEQSGGRGDSGIHDSLAQMLVHNLLPIVCLQDAEGA